MLPRRIVPRSTYLVTRRIQDRRFLLRPDARLTNLFLYLLGLFTALFDIEVHAVTCLSTHFHLVVSAPRTNISELMHRFDMHMACALQVLRKLGRGVVWEPGKLNITQLVTPEAVVEKIAYTLVNSVAAGAVYEYTDWPGVIQAASDLGRRTFHAERPDFYFDDACWPETTQQPLTLPACLAHLDSDEARALLEREVAMQQAAARAEVKRKGWKVMGRVAARNVSPYRRATSWERFGELTPHVAAGRGQTAARVAALETLMEFRADHHEAKLRWMAGDRAVRFPVGTYWMRVHHGAACEPFT